MKIGIVTSGVDMLVLFRFLSKYNFQYEIVYDDLGWPWADKPLDFVLERAGKAIDCLQKKGCKKIIVPPVVEVAFHHEEKYADLVLPLRHGYLLNECLSASAVGKIWFAGEYVDMVNKELFETVSSAYKPNETQQKRVNEIAAKKPSYAWSLSFWRKEITMRKYYLTKLSFKSEIVHHAMKADRRYFKDALVDTIVPTSYGFFAYETALGKFLNTKKQSFHRLVSVERQFLQLIENWKLEAEDYSVSISYTGTLDHLLREKKWMWMLQRGQDISINMDKISL